MSAKVRDLEAVGVQRDSNNQLLVKSELGKVRSRCYSLPGEEFTYGIRSTPLDGGVAEAVSHWYQHKKSVKKEIKRPERDFIALNVAACKSGLTTAHEQSQFRSINDIRRKPPDVEGRRSKTLNFPEDVTFGISTRPSTPLFELLENRYQARWIEEQKKADQKARKMEFDKKLHGKIYETRASLLRKYSEPVDPPPYWKMSRFSKVPAKLQSFRTDKEKSAAFVHHASDSTSRTGIFGHGIYTAAKS